MTALHTNSKADTILLLDSTAASVHVDLGQERTDLTVQAGYLDESPSARSAIDAPRNITAKVVMQSSTDGHILELGTAAKVYSYKITMPNPGEVVCAEAGLVRATLNVPGLSGVDSTILINWSQRIEGSNVVDDVAIGNLTTGAWVFASGSHAASTPDPAHTLTIAASYGGSGGYSGGIGDILAVHIGRRFHTATEASEDWVGVTVPPVLTGRRRTPMLTGPSNELGVGNQGAMAGPVYLWALGATREADSRTVTPLVNVVPADPYIETNTYAPVRYFKSAPDNAKYHMSTRYLFHAFVSPKTNYARVRVHARIWNDTSPGTVCTVYLRAYSMAHLPRTEKGKAPAPLVYYKATATIAAETSGGAWVDIGLLRLAREPSGLSAFVLAFSFGLDTGAAVEDETWLRINAITVEPLYIEADDDAFELSE